jgi:hypothetical protein
MVIEGITENPELESESLSALVEADKNGSPIEYTNLGKAQGSDNAPTLLKDAKPKPKRPLQDDNHLWLGDKVG